MSEAARAGRPRQVAVIGAGPAGIYAADILAECAPDDRIDLFERLPAPYGLVRYGVSPDHPRIKKIIESLHVMLASDRIRLMCDVEIGADITMDELRAAYDAVIVATGAIRDAPLDIPGIALPGSFGAADFVSWYDGHPDVAQTWSLEAESVAVIGAGNVALDVARMLIKHVRTLAATDISDNVERGLAANPIRDLHLFARRGPADVRFSPLELRELGEQEDVDVIVDPAELEPNPHLERMTAQFAQRRALVRTMRGWAALADRPRIASRRVHLHFNRAPAALLGDGRVETLRVERTAPDGLGRVHGTGVFEHHPVQAVYRAIGYAGSRLDGVPFDEASATIPHDAGAILDDDGVRIPGLFATGWIKRGPVGLIGSTKADARQTIETLVSGLPAGAGKAGGEGIVRLLRERGRVPIGWDGWLRIDEAERRLGAERGRERTKIADRAELAGWARENVAVATSTF